MRNDHSAKLRRRSVALSNLKTQLQAWKSATSDEAITALLSTKVLRKFGGAPTSENLKTLRKYKIELAEHEIGVLEKRV